MLTLTSIGLFYACHWLLCPIGDGQRAAVCIVTALTGAWKLIVRLARTGDVSWNALIERPRLMTMPAVVASSVRSAASIYMLAGRVLQSVVSVCLASLTFDPDFL